MPEERKTMTRGFSVLRYGFGKEDWKSWASESEKLKLNPAYTIHCITLGKLLRLSEFLFPHQYSEDFTLANTFSITIFNVSLHVNNM